MLRCKCPAFWYILPSINTIFFHTFECFWSVWYFFLPHLRFCILFRVCSLLTYRLMWYRLSWSFCLNSHKTCWWDPGFVYLYRNFVFSLSIFRFSFWMLPLIFKFDFRCCFFSHFHRRNIHSNGGYLNDRHLKIIQFKSHFLAEIGNVDTFICACYSRSYCSSSSHFNKRAQCPEKQIVWLSFASPSKMCAHIMCMQAWWHSNKTFK